MQSKVDHNLLRQRREQKGLTVSQLAKILDMWPSQVLEIEQGKRSVISKRVLPYCKALDIQPNDMYVWCDSIN